jgi:hypothetical protein
METLADFVMRLSKDVGCYYHLIPSGDWYTFKKHDSNEKGQMGVFGYVKELKRKDLFLVDIIYDFAKKAKVDHLANKLKDNINWNKPGILFYVKKDSHGSDYNKAVTALKAIKDVR